MTRKEFRDKYLDMANDIRDERTQAEITAALQDGSVQCMTADINLLVLPKMLAIVLGVIEDIKELD